MTSTLEHEYRARALRRATGALSEDRMRRLKSKSDKKSVVFWLFLFPALLLFFFVMIIPFIMGIVYSFSDWSSSAKTGAHIQFIGLTNYFECFEDPSFLYSIAITVFFSVFNIAALNIVALCLALLVTSKIKYAKVYRAGFFIPYLIGGLVLGYVWQFFFNNTLPAIGKAFAFLADFADPDHYVLSDVTASLFAMVFVNTWKYAGYFMMVFIAAIESIPVELMEAGRIDGANPLQQLFHIIIPMIAQAFTITLFLALLSSFKEFDVNISFTGGGPSVMFMGQPIMGTQLLALHIYNEAFVANNLAGAQARAVLFFLVVGVISIFQVRATKKREIEL